MIPEIKKILYATDLTKNSTYAFYYAVDMARKHDASIVILHCVESLLSSVYSEMLTSETFKNIQKSKEAEKARDTTEIRQLLQQFCESVEAQIGPPCINLVFEILVNEGHPPELILNTADSKECDVIVLGTHGKGWLKQTFIGSTARSVLGRTRKPVFIVPLPAEKTGIEIGDL